MAEALEVHYIAPGSAPRRTHYLGTVPEPCPVCGVNVDCELLPGRGSITPVGNGRYTMDLFVDLTNRQDHLGTHTPTEWDAVWRGRA